MCLGGLFSAYKYIIYVYSLQYTHIYRKHCNLICIQYTCIRDVNLLLHRSEYIFVWFAHTNRINAIIIQRPGADERRVKGGGKFSV